MKQSSLPWSTIQLLISCYADDFYILLHLENVSDPGPFWKEGIWNQMQSGKIDYNLPITVLVYIALKKEAA